MKVLYVLLVLILLLLAGIAGFIAGRALSQPRIKAVHMSGQGHGMLQTIGKPKPVELQWKMTVEPEYSN